MHIDSDLQNQQTANAYSGLYSTHTESDKYGHYSHNSCLKYNKVIF